MHINYLLLKLSVAWKLNNWGDNVLQRTHLSFTFSSYLIRDIISSVKDAFWCNSKLCVIYNIVVWSSRESRNGRGVFVSQWLWTLAAQSLILIRKIWRTGWSWVEVIRLETKASHLTWRERTPSHSTWRKALTAVQVCLLFLCVMCTVSTGCVVQHSGLCDMFLLDLNVCDQENGSGE